MWDSTSISNGTLWRVQFRMQFSNVVEKMKYRAILWKYVGNNLLMAKYWKLIKIFKVKSFHIVCVLPITQIKYTRNTCSDFVHFYLKKSIPLSQQVRGSLLCFNVDHCFYVLLKYVQYLRVEWNCTSWH